MKLKMLTAAEVICKRFANHESIKAIKGTFKKY